MGRRQQSKKVKTFIVVVSVMFSLNLWFFPSLGFNLDFLCSPAILIGCNKCCPSVPYGFITDKLKGAENQNWCEHYPGQE